MLLQTPVLLVLGICLAHALPSANIVENLYETRTEAVSTTIQYNGLGTVYTQQNGTGSCGGTFPDDSFIVALSNYWMNKESPSPLCWNYILVNNTGSDDSVGGIRSSIIALIADTCPSCNKTHLDFSVGAWNRLTENAAFGTINISWHVLRSIIRQDYN